MVQGKAQIQRDFTVWDMVCTGYVLDAAHYQKFDLLANFGISYRSTEANILDILSTFFYILLWMQLLLPIEIPCKVPLGPRTA